MWIYIFLIVVLLCIVIIIQFNIDIRRSYERLNKYDFKTINTEYGKANYFVEGEGDSILISHGIFGGYDQGYVSLKGLVGENYKKISVSRFGYVGSDLPQNPTPENQAKVFKEILDELNIEKTYVITTSAGGAAGIRFAIDFPERTKGLILLSSGCPSIKKTKEEIKQMGMMGPPSLFVNDFPMWFCMKYFSFIFNSMMGSKVNTEQLFDTMLPVKPRRAGIMADTNITNIDMMLNYDDYSIENIKAPVLVIHAKDDPMAKYEDIQKFISRINPEKAIFDTGGHLISGHGEEINNCIIQFINSTK